MQDIVWERNKNGHYSMCRFFEKIINETNFCEYCSENNFSYLLQDETYDYHTFHKWSVDHIEEFWKLFFEFSQIKVSQDYSEVITAHEKVSDIPKWFVGCKLNYAENILRDTSERVAITSVGEGVTESHMTFKQLNYEVRRMACLLKELGIKKGDVVASLLPNVGLAVVSMLATTSLGAIWTCASPETQTKGIVMRIKQTSPKVLLSYDQVVYNKKTFFQQQKLEVLAEELTSLTHIIVTTDTSLELSDISSIPKSHNLETLLRKVSPSMIDSFLFEQVSFDHPLFIMYSSGTTGIPKGLVHSVGGTLIQHLKDHILHGSLTQNDVHFYYTITAWMMWNWMVTSLYTGCRIVVYNGSPFYPDYGCLWDVVMKFKVTMLGAGAAYYQTLENVKFQIKDKYDLTNLKVILSTGSVLPDHTYDYLTSFVKNPLQICSIAAATDIISCFGGVNPLVNVYRGQVQCRNLAMDIESWNPEGKSQYNKSGELVVKRPFPSMPIFIWNDTENKKYTDTYFSRYPGYWAQGDYCKIVEETRGIIMLGRSDATLNPFGVRFGSAEIYSVVESMEEIDDSLCVGQYHNEIDRVILFIKMNVGYKFDEAFVERIRELIRNNLSSRHIPAIILEISDVPYTLTGKKIELAVKKILQKEPYVIQKESLKNPEALDQFHDFVNKNLL